MRKRVLRQAGKWALSWALVVAMALPGLAVEVKGFSDVPADHWGHDAILDMAGRGLLIGTTSPDANGLAAFEPNAQMTKAAYITVAVRIACPYSFNSKNALGQGQYWWSDAYDLAKAYGILTADDPGMGNDPADMGAVITREEMAMILIRTAHLVGVSTRDKVYDFQISDYNKINSYYRDSVRECYALGILSGTGSGFEPQKALDRVSACQSFYNLLVPEVRRPTAPEPNQHVGYPAHPDHDSYDEPITIIEGAYRTDRFAKEGDTVIKADGTQVVLKKGPHGILGEGQGVAPDLGFSFYGAEGSPVTNGESIRNVPLEYTDSLGIRLNNRTYEVNPYTGEGHWDSEWETLIKVYPSPYEDGTYDKELSKEGLSLWIWDEWFEEWDFTPNLKQKR